MQTYYEFYDDERLVISFSPYEVHALVRRGRRFYRVVSNPFPFVYRVVEYKPWSQR